MPGVRPLGAPAAARLGLGPRGGAQPGERPWRAARRCVLQVCAPRCVPPGVRSLGRRTLQGCRGFPQDTQLPLHPQGGCESLSVTWAAPTETQWGPGTRETCC